MKLYPYQADDSKKIQKFLDKGKSVIYQLPTGGGKSYVIQDVIFNNPNDTVLLLVHKREIIFQLYKTLKEKNLDVGILVGDIKENPNAKILIGSILTVVRDKRIDDVINRNNTLLIIDEAHHACSSSYKKVISQLEESNPNLKKLGVTATPYRKDKKLLSDIFSDMVTGLPIRRLQEQGYLSKCRTYVLNLKHVEEVKKSGGDYNISALSRFMRQDNLIQLAIKEYELKGENKQMLVFCVDQKHGKKVQQAYVETGYKDTQYIDSNTPNEKRDQIIKDFRNKKYKILVSIQTLTEGTDIPDAHVCQLLRPTLSLTLYLQIVGRILRVKDDGEEAIILDIANCSKEHGLVTTPRKWGLQNQNPNIENKNKILVGKSSKGLTDDIEVISDENLEVEEITYEEYLSQKQDGVEKAEENNKELDNQIEEIYNKIIEYVQNLFPKHQVKKDTWSYKEVIIADYLKFSYNNVKINYKDNSGYYTSKPLEYFIEMGNIAKILNKKQHQKQLMLFFIEIKELKSKKINIPHLRGIIDSVREEQIASILDKNIKKGNYIFKTKETFRLGSYFKNIYDYRRRYYKIEFIEHPKKLKVKNEIKFYDKEGYSFTKSISKEILVKIIKRNELIN